MRLGLFLGLLILGLTVVGSVHRYASLRRERHATLAAVQALPKPRKDSERGEVRRVVVDFPPQAEPVVSRPEETPLWTATVTGKGKTMQDAEDDALDEARSAVILYLRNQKPPVRWVPPQDFVSRKLVKEQHRAEPKKVEPCDEFPNGLVEQYTVQVAVTADLQREMADLARRAQMQERMLLLAKLLAVLVGLLGVAAGYVRLDEWSKGYYTGWLRLAAAGFVAAGVGMGVWLVNSH
ncbi:MAG: hypothetical protein JO112_21040 [Planctomycetes bacterium]|nr:hypothetical protein [Planctomycetota bacterium]